MSNLKKVLRVLAAVFGVAVLPVLAGVDAQAATLNVPANYLTIQGAINAASNGDTVLVDSGTYKENITFSGKAITVKSVNGTTSTIIDGNKLDRVVTFIAAGTKDVVLEGFTITNGRASDGAGIYCYKSSPTITNCAISSNSGSGIYCSSSSPAITNCTISNNSGSSGGICCSSSSPTITNCTISNNSGSSGGIYCTSSSPTITNCTITNNTANYGGGICCSSSSPTITNCTITNNTANYHGGGIYCESSSSPTITNCTISSNSANNNDGGGIYCQSYSSPTIINCTISNNSATNGGGICCSSSSSPKITNCTITNNTAYGNGGGIYCTSSSPTITNCTITNNTANSGGGIYCTSSSPTITNCTISSNSAKNNSSGGGICCSSSSSPTITNCLITTNSAINYGGGIYCTSSSPKITNCTITNNTANSYGGGIYCDSSYSAPTVVNTIFWNNIPEEIFLKAASISITYSDIKGGWAGAGNINANPLFVSDNNEHLQSISPCINKGINTAAKNQSKDKDGNPRIVGGTVDMGAYEFQGGQGGQEGEVPPVTTPALSITKTVDSNFASPGGILEYVVNFKNISSSSLTNITITDKLSNYITCEQNSVSNGGSYNNGAITWNLGSLPGGAQGIVRFKAKVNANTPVGTTIKNNAMIVCAGEATVFSDYARTVIVRSSRAPEITYTPVKFWVTSGTSIDIKAVIKDDVQVAGATLHYRKKETPATSWSSGLMANTTGNTYTGSIPTDAETKGIEYYIEAKDNMSNIATTSAYSITVGYPVLLVHGINGNAAGTWQKDGDGKCNFVKKLGEFANVFTIDLTPSNYKIEELAKQLSNKIESIKLKTKAPHVDVVGYSMGGLVSRWYTRCIGYNYSVRKLIMIGTPNHGSELLGMYYYWSIGDMAEAIDVLDPIHYIFKGAKPPTMSLIEMTIGDPGIAYESAGWEMQPQSTFLNLLNYSTIKKEKAIYLPEKLTSGIEYHTIAGTKAIIGLSALLLGDDDGIVRTDSVELNNVPNNKVSCSHLNITGSEDVCGIVSSILQRTFFPQQAPSMAPSFDEGTPTAVQHMPIIYGTISQSGTKSYNIPVDSTIDEISFLLGWEGGDIGLTLTASDGTLITPTYSTESVSYFNDTQINVAGYTVKNPAAGTWTVNVNADNVSGVGTYSVEILAESTLICSLATDKNVYDPNQPIHITAMLANNNIPLIGASVTVRVITPANVEDILLYDDGTHGDTQSNDGTYTNTYANTNVSGNYYIVAAAIGSINNQPFVRQVNTIIYVEQFPDLTIATSSITFSNNNPIEGEQVTINAAVSNIGDIGATNTAVFFYDRLPSEESILIGSTTVSYIPAGGSGDVSIIWTAASGTHTIQVIVSPYNSFLEKSYDNNSASKEIFVNSPDLSSSLPLIPSCPTSGEMATVTTVIYNTGTTQADNVVVRFFVGNPLGTGTLIGSQTIAAIPANGSETVQLVWNTSGYSGIIAIYVQIDPQNEILEADESNNLSYKEMYIQEVDTESPTVEIISPDNNLTVSGVVKVSAAASDNIGITRVEFYIDGVFCIAAVSPYEYSWDTGSYTNSLHTIKVFAYDSANLSGSNSITVTVDNLFPDTTPPGTITNLSVATATITSIAVTWTAPGDDGYAGTSTTYDIRYAPVMITDDNWSVAVQAAGEPEPKPAGGMETFTITNLQPCTTYYFAIKTSDNAGLWSGLSNITGATTLSAGSISITSTPAGANIWLDGVDKGTVTPAILTGIIPGTHTIKLTKTGYHDWNNTVTVSAGLTTNVPATMITLVVPIFLKITPAAQNAAKGEEFMVDVEVSDVRDMITAEIHLSFNPAVLELQEIGTGTFLESNSVAKRYDNTAGTIDYFAGLFTGSATGSGVIFTMKFKAKAGGTSPVVFDFDESNNRLTRLKDVDGNTILFNKEEAVYNVITGVTGIKIKQQDITAAAGESIVYQCIAICDNNFEIDITGSTTFTASDGGSFTQNAFLAKYSGTYIIQGEYAGLFGTTTVNILPGTSCALVCVSGNNQIDNCMAALKEPFVVKAVDKYNNPCEGVVINWQVVDMPSSSTGYSIYPTSTTTNVSIIASSTLTLGSEPPGTYTISAVSPGLIDSPCTFTANSLRTSGSISGFCLLELGQGRFGTTSQLQVRIEQTEQIGATATINEYSYFIFSGIPVGTYTLNFDSRGAASKVVSNVHILSTQLESTTHIGTITLLAGDITNDGKINLADWPGFVNAFFKQDGDANWEEDKQTDFNHDGKVNDEDFIVLRNNFGKQTEGMVMNAPSMTKAAASGNNVELSFNLDTLDGVDVNELQVGNIIYLKVYIRNAKDLLGAEVHLSFDPKVLEVVNVPVPERIMLGERMNVRRFSPGASGIQAGGYFTADVWELMNRVDNIAGRIDYSVGVLKPQQTKDEGILAIMPLKIKSAGVSSNIGVDFKKEDNRQTFFIERRYAEPAGAEGKPVDTISEVRAEEIVINVPRVTPDDIRVYPNPVDAGKGKEVIFDQLPTGKQVTLKIYNLAGELVFEESGVGSIRWGLRNNDDESVASGIYVYCLRDESGVIKQGKIGVIR